MTSYLYFYFEDYKHFIIGEGDCQSNLGE